LRRELRGIPWRQRRRVLVEARDHLLSSMEDGCGEPEAVARFGAPGGALARVPSHPPPPRPLVVRRPPALAAPALAPALAGSLPRLGSGRTPSRAAGSPISRFHAATARCVRAWNAPASVRWRALARSLHVRRAHIGAWYGGTTRRDLHFAGCTVG